jgi:ABC-type glutathione transport system ATPase component
MSTQQATTQQPLLQAIDLKKHYPVKKGLFAPERLVKALDGVSFTSNAVKRWRWWGVRLREIHAGPSADDD